MTIDKITDNYNPQGTGTACNYTNACAYKLPCGLCRLLMSQCPKDCSTSITWTSLEVKP
jgi:hypothetical protein